MRKVMWTMLTIVSVAAGLFATSGLTAAKTGSAVITLTNASMDVGTIDVYIDHVRVTEGLQMTDPAFSTQIAPGHHLIDVFPAGENIVLIETTAMTFESDHIYQLALIGLQAGWTVQLVAIDQTAEQCALGSQATSNPQMVINGLTDAPPLDIYLNDRLVVEGLDFGKYRCFTMPDNPADIKVTFAGMPNQVVFSSSGLATSITILTGDPSDVQIMRLGA
jgi:uncharacterized protein DUF4397